MSTKLHFFRRLFNLGLLLLLAAGLSSLGLPASETRSFQIMEQSELYLKGSSNVTPFTCQCTQSFPPLQYTMALNAQGAVASFRNTSLQLQTKKLDCGNRGMNRDMHQTLKADQHPNISIRLQEVQFEGGKLPEHSQDLGSLWAKARIAVAGVEKTAKLKVSARETGKGAYRFKSEFTINMTDFGIEPPTALMGLIKVDNKVTIHLDLAVRLEDSVF